MKEIKFGDRLAELLEENGMTQQKLSDELFISPSTLNGYIRNYRFPEYSMLLRISRLFNISCDYLLGNSTLKTNDGDILDSQESRIIEMYRKMDDVGKDLLLEEAKLLYKNFH